MTFLIQDANGLLSRNYAVPIDHPDAWVLVTGPWHGLSVSACACQRGTTEPLVPPAPVWTPGGER